MLTSCTIHLSIDKEVLVPPSLGQVLHAFFLDRVRALDAGRAEQLHSSAPVKPFTVSPLWGRVEFEDNRWRLFPGEDYYFRVTSISPGLSQWLRETWAPSLPGEIELAGAGFKVNGYSLDAGENTWAGISSYQDIYNTSIFREEIPGRFTLKFFSPTTFRSQGSNYPLPDPQKVFLNLLQKWNKYSPVHLGDNYIEFIEKNVYPAGYGLKTRIMHFHSYKQVGFVGTCTFGVRKQKEDITARVLHMLAEYAFYAGVGYKTTMGMGQARVEK